MVSVRCGLRRGREGWCNSFGWKLNQLDQRQLPTGSGLLWEKKMTTDRARGLITVTTITITIISPSSSPSSPSHPHPNLNWRDHHLESNFTHKLWFTRHQAAIQERYQRYQQWYKQRYQFSHDILTIPRILLIFHLELSIQQPCSVDTNLKLLWQALVNIKDIWATPPKGVNTTVQALNSVQLCYKHQCWGSSIQSIASLWAFD